MKMSGGPASVNLKLILILIALAIAFGTLYYTNQLVSKLQEKERQIVELYAKGIEYIANTDNPDADITFLFDNIIKPIDFPLILTDKDDNINLDSKSDLRNIKLDSTLSRKQQEEFLYKMMKEMDELHPPINITYADTLILTRIHYGDSELIKQLQFYPYLQIAIAGLFILLGYIGFSYIKKSEQSNIWVGMAKETAHQFGTPISSLMGWLEMLKLNYNDPNKVLDIAEEISNDVEKLNKITIRFSKIGSKPDLKPQNLFEEVTKVTDYFNRRLPQTGKTVELQIKGDKNLCAMINSDLFEWVIENLIKNALDAIEDKNGLIAINIIEGKKFAEVEVADNGKGIDLKRRKDVFRPGYSTKKRGWGLGLSLSKRIIEGYHGGKIFVKSSIPNEGTVFKILLKKC
ncbi:HAMP domain-containing sensor histidine kinase [Ignavibacterium sp.]|uniref:sensor histidine kinase n=1 Tax=Ignavibacterium sp. TaxID=2651167 RepID=UPI0021FE6037|nr:HAMP domain-containing sensor histidine kinase [Ignavibacterium sp.]BDQ04279.1 MAG: two-component sensor histidine kinase [Ignavibacterium sp.]